MQVGTLTCVTKQVMPAFPFPQGAAEVWRQLPYALLARVVQPATRDGHLTTAIDRDGPETSDQVAAMSAVVQMIIQKQRNQRQELTATQKLAAQMRL